MWARALGNPWTCEIPGTPVPKPRMTQRDKWLPSKPTQRYRHWADHVRLVVGQSIRAPYHSPVAICAKFLMPLPKSLSDLEKRRRLALPHTQKPDLKNLVAGLEDALNRVAWTDDAVIYEYRDTNKSWTKERQGLTILIIYPLFAEGDRV